MIRTIKTMLAVIILISVSVQGQTTQYFYPDDPFNGAYGNWATGYVNSNYTKVENHVHVGDPTLASPRRGFIYFDVTDLPEECIIQDVKVHLYPHNPGGSNHYLGITQMTLHPWSYAGDLLWDDINSDHGYYDGYALAGVQDQWVVITLNSLSYNDIPMNTSTELTVFGIGLLEIGDDDNNSQIYGFLDGAYKPKLEVTYLTPPSPPTSPIPPNGTEGEIVNVVLNWSDGGGADGYNVYFGTDPSPDAGEYIGNTENTYFIPDGNPQDHNTTYYWRIDAVNLAGTTTGNVWHFTTSDAPQPPSQATNPSPSNGATNQSISVNLSWLDGGGATSFDVYLGTDSSPDAGEFRRNQGSTSYDPGTLQNNTTYYWRIDAVNNNGTTSGSVWQFTTTNAPQPPSQATIPSPPNAATNQSTNVNLGWSDGGGATSYDVYFGMDSSPDAGEYWGNQGNTSYDPGTLQYSVTYFWRIDAVNNNGTTTGSVWHFTTGESPSGPTIFDESFSSIADWTLVTSQGTGSLTAGTYGGENVGILYMSGSPGVFNAYRQIAIEIPAGSALTARWYYESSGIYDNSENSDGGRIRFTSDISSEGPSEDDIILSVMQSVDFSMYQWNEEEFIISENIPSGSYIAIGGAVWPSYIYNNWDFITVVAPTGLINEDSNISPSEISLSQNYPNPFNPSTTIHYGLPEASKVQMTVYDVTGRQVRTLVNNIQQAGSYTIQWNGTDVSGQSVGTGTYLARIQAGDYSKTIKMVYLR